MRLALNAGQALTPTDLGVFQALWLDGFEDLPYNVLEAAFRKTLRECKYWPVKIADVRERVDRTRETAVAAAAEIEWQRAFDLRRLQWNPDIPGIFDREVAKLPERVKQAARAAGLWRDFDSVDDLHIWAKKRFIEAYIAWDELQQDQFLLPEGELKNLLARAAEAKVLPPTSVEWNDLHSRGLEYAKTVSAGSARPDRVKATPTSENPRVVDVEGRRGELARQAAIITQKYPAAERSESRERTIEGEPLSDALREIRECKKLNQQDG